MNNNNTFTTPLSDLNEKFSPREYIAVHADIPWNVVIDTLAVKFPHKNGNFTINEVIQYRVKMMVIQADMLIGELNNE